MVNTFSWDRVLPSEHSCSITKTSLVKDANFGALGLTNVPILRPQFRNLFERRNSLLKAESF